MKKKILKIFLILLGIVIIVIPLLLLIGFYQMSPFKGAGGGFGLKLPSVFPKKVSNQSISGFQIRSQIWSGEITVTGDTTILSDLTILPGTKIKFVVGDDKKRGGPEVPVDGYLDFDPTRLASYGKTHSGLAVLGKLYAVGTPENRILFTSAAENPKIADWDSLSPWGDGSLIEYATIEYMRVGIAPGTNTPSSIFRNNVVRYAMWGNISTGWSGAQVYNNEIYETGHEGIDVQGGNPIIENNTIYNCNCGIVVLRGSAKVRNNKITNCGGSPEYGGLHIGKDATPVLENNYYEPAPPDSDLKWCYEDFCYLIYKEPSRNTLLSEVYKKNNLARYAVPAYKIELQEPDYIIKLPFEAEWLIYGWKDNQWNIIKADITDNKCILPRNYSMYVLIPNPTEKEKNAEWFNKKHSDIYKTMSV